MQKNFDPKATADFSFQVDLLNLNLNLAAKERPQGHETKANEAAITEIRTLAKRY